MHEIVIVAFLLGNRCISIVQLCFILCFTVGECIVLLMCFKLSPYSVQLRTTPQQQPMAPYPSQQSPVQPGMFANHLPHQQSATQIPQTGGQIVYVQSHSGYPPNTATYQIAGTEFYVSNPACHASMASRNLQEPSATIPVWTSASAGGVPVTAVGKSDAPFVANCIVTESNVVPTTAGGVVMTPAPGPGVEMQAMTYGSPQSVYMYPPPQDYMQLVQVMHPPSHHLQQVAAPSMGTPHQPGNPILNSTK